MTGLFKPRTFVRAGSAQEVLEVQRQYGERARIVGGNTFLNELAKRGLLGEVEALIDIGPLRLRYLRTAGSLKIGASATIQDLADDTTIASSPSLRALSQAARSVHPPQVRNTATAAGCISTGLSFLDVPVALLALDARVRLSREGGETEVPLEEYMGDAFNLTRVGFVRELAIGAPATSASSFGRFSVTGTDYAAVNAAVSLSQAGGACSRAAIYVGGSGIDLRRAREAESLLLGKRLTDDGISGAADVAAASASVKDDIPIRGSAEYKRRVVKVVVAKALREAASGLASGGSR